MRYYVVKTAAITTLAEIIPLSPAEKRIIDSIKIPKPATGWKNYPGIPTSENTIRAEFLKLLLLAGNKDDFFNSHIGINLHGFWIEGILDLENSNIVNPIKFSECTFSDPINLKNSKLNSSLSLTGCEIKRINCSGIKVDGSILIQDSIISKGEIDLTRSRIRGDIDLKGSSVSTEFDYSLLIDDSKIDGSILLEHDFQSSGSISFRNTIVGRNLKITKAKISGRNRKSVSSNGSRINGFVSIKDSDIDGTLEFGGAVIKAHFSLDNSYLNGDENLAIQISTAHIGESLFIRNIKLLTGIINLSSCKISRNLEFISSRIIGLEDICINANGSIIGGSLHLRNCVLAGSLNLTGIHVKRNFELISTE
jgi:hypothetical protein